MTKNRYVQSIHINVLKDTDGVDNMFLFKLLNFSLKINISLSLGALDMVFMFSKCIATAIQTDSKLCLQTHREKVLQLNALTHNQSN